MKRLEKKYWIPSLILAIALLVLPPLLNSHVALANDDREEHNVKYEENKIEDKQVGDSNIRKYEREDDEEESNEDSGEHEGNYRIDNANDPNNANNATNEATPTAQPSLSPSFENGQSAFIQVAGQSATLNVILNVGQGGGSKVRVDAEKMLDFMKVPYVKYNKKSLLEMYADGRHVIFKNGKSMAFVNGQKQSLPAAPIFQNGEFLIPLDVLANQLGYSLEWHADSKTFIMKRGV